MSASRGQDGTSLIELVVALSIGAVILLGAGESIFQMLRGVDRGVVQLTALRNSENARIWLTRDTRMADSTSLSDGGSPSANLTLQWTDIEGGQTHVASYTVSGSDLIRDLDGSTLTVARHVNAVGFSRNGKLLTLQIEVVPDGAQITLDKTYTASMRPD